MRQRLENQLTFNFSVFYLLLLCLELAPLQGLAQSNWVDYKRQTTESWRSYEDQEVNRWKQYHRELELKWGSEARLSSQKNYIIYKSNNSIRTQVNYETGEITVEVLSDKVLSKNSATQVLSEPAILKQLIEDKVIYTEEVSKKSEWSSKSDKLTGTDGKVRHRKTYHTKMAANHLNVRMQKYLPLVQYWANKNNIEPAFVLAVIECESAFNPRARSWAPAYGLMQIVPKYAGAAVLNYTPTEEFLYDPQNNIKIGTAYIKILQEEYFKDIKSNENKRYFVTCAYNCGPSRILKNLTNGKLGKLEKSNEIFDELIEIVPSETKDYLRKVTISYEKYKGLISTLAKN